MKRRTSSVCAGVSGWPGFRLVVMPEALRRLSAGRSRAGMPNDPADDPLVTPSGTGRRGQLPRRQNRPAESPIAPGVPARQYETSHAASPRPGCHRHGTRRRDRDNGTGPARAPKRRRSRRVCSSSPAPGTESRTSGPGSSRRTKKLPSTSRGLARAGQVLQRHQTRVADVETVDRSQRHPVAAPPFSRPTTGSPAAVRRATRPRL